MLNLFRIRAVWPELLFTLTNKKNNMRYFLFSLALSTLFACSQPSRPMSGNDARPRLEERQWQLIILNQQAITLSPKPYFLIKGASVKGNLGCNSFTGDVRLDGPTMVFSNLISLLKACEGIEVEKDFMEVLLATNGYRQNSDTLFLLRDQRDLAMMLGTKQ